jgi:ribosomal-protein-alanine N-acetyltransferase
LPIRTITMADLGPLEVLDKKCFSDAVRYNRFAFDYYLSIPNSIGLLKAENKKLFGFIITAPISDDIFNIVTIDIDPEFRRKGIGSELILAVKRILKRWEIQKITLQVSIDNVPAIQFYMKHGFEIVEELPKYYPDNDGYQMEYVIK